MCDELLGTGDGFNKISQLSYTGPCDDVVVVNDNIAEKYAGLSLAIEHDRQIFSTGFGLDITYAASPPSGYLSNPRYNFNAWEHVTSAVGSIPGIATSATRHMMEEYAAMLVGPRDNTLGLGQYVYKVSIPICSDMTDIGQFWLQNLPVHSTKKLANSMRSRMYDELGSAADITTCFLQ